jgi:hypothetical protein
MSISLVVILVLAFAPLQAYVLWPRLARHLRVWSYPLVIVLAVHYGYQWHVYDYPRSEAGQLDEARRVGCAKSIQCQKAAVEYMTGRPLD